MITRPTNSGSLHPIGRIATEIVSDMRFRREVKRLHRLGPRVLAELLAELAAERNIRVLVERKIDKYTELDPEVLEAAGGAGFWPFPVREARNDA